MADVREDLHAMQAHRRRLEQTMTYMFRLSLTARPAITLRHHACLWLHWTRLYGHCFPRLSAVPGIGKRYHDTQSGCHTSITRFPQPEDFRADHSL